MQKQSNEQWITESANGYGMTVKVKSKLYEAQSPFQKIEVYDTDKLGRILLLDGIIQLTENDEFAYQEMMTHPAMMAHHNPENILIVGGGDGGVLREAGRYSGVKHIDLCDIDGMVVECAKKFLPSLSCGFDDPRVTVHIEDAVQFIKRCDRQYDVVIIDSTDPGGVANPLFSMDFYRDVRKSLRSGGVVSAQSESPFLLPEVVRSLRQITSQVFRYTEYAMIYVPSYPTGCIAAGVYSDDHEVNRPVRPMPPELAGKLKYYNEEVHAGSMLLPNFVRDILSGKPL